MGVVHARKESTLRMRIGPRKCEVGYIVAAGDGRFMQTTPGRAPILPRVAMNKQPEVGEAWLFPEMGIKALWVSLG